VHAIGHTRRVAVDAKPVCTACYVSIMFAAAAQEIVCGHRGLLHVLYGSDFLAAARLPNRE